MSRIRILPEILSNKIAAGEVVERPASVVKELVENAIDAGSSRIIVEIEQGGRKLIRVSDNGQGMGRDDALLCLERYATSKILREPDLFAIRTLGFRGEALPSIAAVSRFSLTTREADADVGTRIEVDGGRITDVADVGAPDGTMVAVAGLFFNTPARRKFLKSVNTEMGHIADTIASMALCRPSVQFRLTHNDRIVKSWAPAADPMDRVVDVIGSAVRKDLLEVAHAGGDLNIRGWVAAPRLNRATARGIYLFVNGRWIRDRVIQHALLAGYSGRLMKGQYPVAVLFLTLPFDQVDVNVHPTKHEIRLMHQKDVHDAVRETVAEALRGSDPTRWGPTGASSADTVAEPEGPPYRHAPQRAFRPSSASAKDESSPLRQPLPPGRKGVRPGDVPPSTTPTIRTAAIPAAGGAGDRSITRQPTLWTRRFFGDLRLIGQFKGTYILCESEDGLILIDQHAAHERIVFEQLRQGGDGRRPPSQRLLMPETVELGFREAGILARLVPELDRFGLEIEPFGGNTFAVKALPTLLDSRDIASLVTQLVERTADIGVDAEMEAIMDGCLMVMACHHAIRAHQRLDDRQIRTMLDQLDACNNPSHCPHGRPIWLRWSVNELAKRFQRIVS